MNEDRTQDFSENAGNIHPEIGSVQMRRQIGEEIKKHREAKELTLEQVHAITKINIKLIKDIEEGRWTALAPIYIKMFILTLAETVELSNDQFVKNINNMFRSTISDGLGKHLGDSKDDYLGEELSPSGRSKGLGSKIALFSVIGVLLLALLIYLLWPTQSEMEGPVTDLPQVATPETTTPAPPQPVKPLTAPDSLTKPKEQFERSIPLVITATQASNVTINHNGITIHDQMLYSGLNINELMPYPISVTVSNPEGLKVTWDGVNQDIGKSKKSTTFTLTKR